MIYVRCALGIHGYDIQDEAVVRTETWHKTHYGQKVEGSEYTREVIVGVAEGK